MIRRKTIRLIIAMVLYYTACALIFEYLVQVYFPSMSSSYIFGIIAGIQGQNLYWGIKNGD